MVKVSLSIEHRPHDSMKNMLHMPREQYFSYFKASRHNVVGPPPPPPSQFIRPASGGNGQDFACVPFFLKNVVQFKKPSCSTLAKELTIAESEAAKEKAEVMEAKERVTVMERDMYSNFGYSTVKGGF